MQSPTPETNLCEYLLCHSESDAPAVLHKQETITHRQLAQEVTRTAYGLTAAGVTKGDVVPIVGENSIQFVVWYLGVIRCGAVAMPLSGNESARVKRAALQLPGVRFLLCQKKFLPSIDEILQAVPAVQALADVPQSSCDGDLGSTCANDLATLMLTSGSTGDPKAVCVSHNNIIANTESILSYLKLSPFDRMMVILPFHYCFGLSLLHTHLRAGASVVLNNHFMFPTQVLEEIESKHCTGFAGVPSTYQILLRQGSLGRTNLSSLQHIQQSGGRLPPRSIRELRDALPTHTKIFIMYGITEATSRVSYLPDDRLSEKIGSVGIPVAGLHLEIQDEKGRPLPRGETGEVVARGPSITAGYYHDAQLTATKFRDGCFYTGDIGYCDDDGFYFLVGRKSDFIKNYGYRVSPHEIEEVLAALPGVSEAVVFGMPDEEAGESIAALVVPANGADLTSDDVMQHCLQHLPNSKIPNLVRMVQQIPKNPAGKILMPEVLKSIGTVTK